MLREGRLAERGPYRSLLARGVDFHQFEKRAPSDEEAASPSAATAAAAGDVDSAEEQEGRQQQQQAAAAGAPGGPRDSAIELQSRGQAGPQDGAAPAGGSMPDASGGLCAAAETAAVFSEVSLLDGSDAGTPQAGAQAAPVGSQQQNGGVGGSGSQRSSQDLSSDLKVRQEGVLCVLGACSATACVPLPHTTWCFTYRAHSTPLCLPTTPPANHRLTPPPAPQFVPKPAPIMAPTRRELLVPPAPAADGAADSQGPGAAQQGQPGSQQGKGGKLTKAEERAVGRVDRQVYLAYFRRAPACLRLPLCYAVSAAASCASRSPLRL